MQEERHSQDGREGGRVDKGDRWGDAQMVKTLQRVGSLGKCSELREVRDNCMTDRPKRNVIHAVNRVCDILACDVLWTSSLVNAPMPLLEMAAREKEYSVFGFRPSTV